MKVEGSRRNGIKLKDSEEERKKLCKTLHRHDDQPITRRARADRQKHKKNLHKRTPLIVTPRRNASITVCMAWRERGDRSHIGDGQQNAIPGSQLWGGVSVIPTALIILPHITLHCWNSHLSAYRGAHKMTHGAHKYLCTHIHTDIQSFTCEPFCIHYCQGRYDVRG